MAIKDFFKKLNPYTVELTCSNCGCPNNQAKVPKGTTVPEFIKSGKFICDNCGCSSTPNEYKTKWLK